MSNDKSELNALLRNDFISFIERTFRTLNPGQQFHGNWHIETIAYHLEQCAARNIRRLIITLPPRHLKSKCVSVAYPAWVLGRDPTQRLICASYSDDLARNLSRDCRSIMQSDWYRDAFPATRLERDSETDLATTRHGFRKATSIGGALTGYGGDTAICDDPIKAAGAMSAAEREQVKNWWSSTLYSRLDNPQTGAFIITMQRVHEDDLVGYVLDKEEWVHINIPAIATEPTRYILGPNRAYDRPIDTVIDPHRMTQTELDAIRATLGSYHYEAQYQGRPVPFGGNALKREWFKTYSEMPDQSTFGTVVQSWDPASATGDKNDYSVCTTWGVKGTDYYLINVVRDRFDFPQLRQCVINEARKYRSPAILIEQAGIGLGLLQDLHQSGAVRAIPWRPIGDKISRMECQSAKLEAGRVLIPEQAPWLHDFEAEILAFPHGRHDDQVDSMSQFLDWISTREFRSRPRPRPNPPRPVGRPHLNREPATRPNYDPTDPMDVMLGRMMRRRR